MRRDIPQNKISVYVGNGAGECTGYGNGRVRDALAACAVCDGTGNGDCAILAEENEWGKEQDEEGESFQNKKILVVSIDAPATIPVPAPPKILEKIILSVLISSGFAVRVEVMKYLYKLSSIWVTMIST